MRRRKVKSFDDYLYSRCEFLGRQGGELDLSMKNAAGELDTVILEARLTFPDELELTLLELVEKTDEGHAHRSKYRYRVRWREVELFRYERDPVRHPEMLDHKHPAGGGRISWGAVRLSAVVDEMWDEYRRRKQPVVPIREKEAERDSA